MANVDAPTVGASGTFDDDVEPLLFDGLFDAAVTLTADKIAEMIGIWSNDALRQSTDLIGGARCVAQCKPIDFC